MEPSTLPPGVNTVGQQPAMPVDQPISAAVPQPQAAPSIAPSIAPAAPIGGEAPAVAGKWDWLQIGAGVVIFTVAIYSIYYFRYKTRVLPEKLKEQDSKISTLKADVESMKNPNG